MARQSFATVFAFVFSILAVLGTATTAPVGSGYAKHSVEVAAAQSQVSDCSDSERGDRGPPRCSLCVALCGAAFTAILPDAASVASPIRSTANPLEIERFSDWRIAPDDSPPRA